MLRGDVGIKVRHYRHDEVEIEEKSRRVEDREKGKEERKRESGKSMRGQRGQSYGGKQRRGYKGKAEGAASIVPHKRGFVQCEGGWDWGFV